MKLSNNINIDTLIRKDTNIFEHINKKYLPELISEI